MDAKILELLAAIAILLSVYNLFAAHTYSCSYTHANNVFVSVLVHSW